MIFMPDYLNTQEMYERIVYKNPGILEYISDHFKNREMCNEAVEEDPLLLRYVPDWFVTQQLVKYLQDDNHDWYNNKLIKWHEGYQKRKA